ncbi:phosphatidate cytidylyltransferase [Betaproteobacteria bacterium]|nr:phosphatidate cytidylyltransferase [Betaproteobacteria bacterium]GHU27382.1 phosphatidate cytidylyltransferase [Betaproteobacteria bacterium]
MLKTRIITAFFLAAGLLAAIFLLDPTGWRLFCALLCAGAAWEWGGLAGWGKQGRLAYGAALGALSFVLSIDFVLSIEFADAILCVLAVGFWVLVVPWWLKYKWRLQNWSAVLVGFIVLVPTTVTFVLLRHDAYPGAVLFILAIVWVADTVAYFSGRAFGRRKLAPTISPGKTWAGAVGAVIGVVVYGNIALMCGLWGYREDLPVFYAEAPVRVVLVALVLQLMFICVAVFSIGGDLFESLLKRLAGVKDSSSLLPGHGGILDRIDSLTSTLPLIGLLLFLQYIFSP